MTSLRDTLLTAIGGGALVAGLFVGSVPAVAAPAQCVDPGSGTPVLLVHGWSGDFTGWTAMAAQLRTMSGVSVDDGFDYGHVNDQWVTNPDISKALAQRIDCLADRSTVNGGNGKVVIVAHSMGGLATRCASSTSCSGGPDITGKLGAVITLGTPNEGSFLRGNSVQSGAEQVVLKSLRLNCWAFARVSGDLCDMRRVMEGPGSTAFTPGSPELKNLPTLPSSVPVAGIAGQVAVTTKLFGRTVTLAGNAGDLVVSVPSAHAAANKVGDLGGPSTVTCSTTMPITRNWALPPCWHGAETSAPEFIDLVRKQIEGYKRATTPDRNVGMHPATPEEARSILTELGLSVPATKLLLANSDPIYGVAVSTISNGEFLVKKTPAGTWEKFPLGSSPEDYCTTAKLSSLGFPAFVQADLVAAKHCWVS